MVRTCGTCSEDAQNGHGHHARTKSCCTSLSHCLNSHAVETIAIEPDVPAQAVQTLKSDQ